MDFLSTLSSQSATVCVYMHPSMSYSTSKNPALQYLLQTIKTFVYVHCVKCGYVLNVSQSFVSHLHAWH